MEARAGISIGDDEDVVPGGAGRIGQKRTWPKIIHLKWGGGEGETLQRKHIHKNA